MTTKRLAWIVGLGLWLGNAVFAQQVAAVPQGPPPEADPSAIEDHPPEGQIVVRGPVLRGFAWDRDAPGAKVSVRVTITTRSGESVATIEAVADQQGAYSRETAGGGHDFVIRLYQELANVDRARLRDVSLRLEMANVTPDGAPGAWVGGETVTGNIEGWLRAAPDTAPLTRKLLLIELDPVCETRGGVRLSELYRAKGRRAGEPTQMARGLVEILKQESGGIMQYQLLPTEYDPKEWPIMRTKILDGKPKWLGTGEGSTGHEAQASQQGSAATTDPYVYSEQYCVPDIEANREPRWVNADTAHGVSADYAKFCQKHHLEERHQAGEFDEVWIYGYWACGFWEATMGGGARPFPTNSQPMGDPDTSATPFHSDRGCVIMGYSWERGYGFALESLGHRMEGTLNWVFGAYNRAPYSPGDSRPDPLPAFAPPGANNPWAQFGATDLTAPDQAGVGDMHYAPQSLNDYKWEETRFVASGADDWLLWPNLRHEQSVINSREYLDQYLGAEPIEAHHRWWFNHLPRAAGSTDGRLNNWWRYFAYPDLVMESPAR